MAKKKSAKQGLKLEVVMPEGVSAELAEANQASAVVIKKGANQNKRVFDGKVVKFALEGNKLALSAPRDDKRCRKLARAFEAHLKNMIDGVQKPHIYKLKICSGHFPMTVALSGDLFTIKNFLGEAVPRVLKIRQGVKVKVSGTEITVESPDIELAGQTAASIETLSRITGRDSRIFQDGIYIIEKDGKLI